MTTPPQAYAGRGDPLEVAMSALDEFRKEKDHFFALDPHSPLTREQQQGFHGLSYFGENPALRLDLSLEPDPSGESVEMQTSTGDVQVYQRLGKVKFEVEGVPVTLTIFTNEHGLFLPFVDSLAGKETYGAGRYLEPEQTPEGNVHIDFNLAYNPYCAYNDRWSCPITPAENRIQAPIRAGEKNFHA
jgi:uncharacterized protein